MIFFTSDCLMLQIPLNNIVILLKNLIKFKLRNLKQFTNRINKKTLATTIVEECNKEDTGVGLSIALGNQGWKKNCEDLAIIQIIKKKLKKLLCIKSKFLVISKQYLEKINIKHK